MAIGIVYGGGIDSGIPSNIGTIKAFCQKQNISLSKGKKQIPLNIPFGMERIVGAIAYYGGYICGQAMLDNNGNYNSEFGLSFLINTGSKSLNIYSAGSYPARELSIMIFYI